MSEPERGPERVLIFDTTLRDGEQSAGVCFSLRDKLDIATALEGLGVDVIEAGFPTSASADAHAVRSVAETVREASGGALSRAVEQDVEETWRVIAPAHRPRLHIVLSCSEIHLEHQLRKSRMETVSYTHLRAHET